MTHANLRKGAGPCLSMHPMLPHTRFLHSSIWYQTEREGSTFDVRGQPVFLNLMFYGQLVNVVDLSSVLQRLTSSETGDKHLYLAVETQRCVTPWCLIIIPTIAGCLHIWFLILLGFTKVLGKLEKSK